MYINSYCVSVGTQLDTEMEHIEINVISQVMAGIWSNDVKRYGELSSKHQCCYLNDTI